MGGPANSQPLVRIGSQAQSLDPGRRVRLNVGGQVFETTLGTVQVASKDSRLVKSVIGMISENLSEVFFDREPGPFATLLNVLRTGKVDDRDEESFNIDRLIREATFYGVVEQLRAALAPQPLDGLDVEKLRPITNNGIDQPYSIATNKDGCLWVGHGSKITFYDWALRKMTTTLTELAEVQVLVRISDSKVVTGSDSIFGLHIYDTVEAIHATSVTWEDKDDPRVYHPELRTATCSDDYVFASFESGQKLDNTVMLLDKNTFKIQREIGRQNGSTAHSRCATKLQWLPGKNLLLVAAAHGGPFGYSGYIRLWDVRQDKVVWDWQEPHYRNPRVEQRDVFADVEANEDLAGIFKLSISSGALAMADLRALDAADPWLDLGESNPDLDTYRGGAENKLITHNKQLYVSRGGDLEVWIEAPVKDSFEDLATKEYWVNCFRRNYVDCRRHMGDPITNLAVGGNRLFITRKGHQAVEVWETKRTV